MATCCRLVAHWDSPKGKENIIEHKKMKSVLVTGSAGFIGANLVLRLLGSQEPLWVELVNLQYKRFTN
jgi:FlaA1/EpsC-like NDP-sugar epimerase